MNFIPIGAPRGGGGNSRDSGRHRLHRRLVELHRPAAFDDEALHEPPAPVDLEPDRPGQPPPVGVRHRRDMQARNDQAVEHREIGRLGGAAGHRRLDRRAAEIDVGHGSNTFGSAASVSAFAGAGVSTGAGGEGAGLGAGSAFDRRRRLGLGGSAAVPARAPAAGAAACGVSVGLGGAGGGGAAAGFSFSATCSSS